MLIIVNSHYPIDISHVSSVCNTQARLPLQMDSMEENEANKFCCPLTLWPPAKARVSESGVKQQGSMVPTHMASMCSFDVLFCFVFVFCMFVCCCCFFFVLLLLLGFLLLFCFCLVLFWINTFALFTLFYFCCLYYVCVCVCVCVCVRARAHVFLSLLVYIIMYI